MIAWMLIDRHGIDAREGSSSKMIVGLLTKTPRDLEAPLFATRE